MRKSRTLNLGTGSFVLLGFAALFFLTTQTTSRGLSFFGPPHYDVTAKFDNVGDLKVEGIDLQTMSADAALDLMIEEGCFIEVATSFANYLAKLTVYDDDGSINVSIRQPLA